MEPLEQAHNFGTGVKMVGRLDGRIPLLMLGYDPAEGLWNIVCHEGIIPVLKNPEQRKSFIAHVVAILEECGHPTDGIQLTDFNAPPLAPPTDMSDLERMLGQEEGGEG